MTTLEQELTAVSGVSRAHVDVSDTDGATLHVELEDDADRDSVAAAVDVVLRRHGLRSRARTVATEALEAVSPAFDDLDPTDPPSPSPLEADSTAGDTVTAPEQPDTAAEGAEPVARSVGVDEVRVGHRSGRTHVAVLTTTGREAASSVVARPEARDQAIVAAVGELVGAGVAPHLIEVRHQEVGTRRAVTVVLDIGDDTVIGTSFERGSRDLGLARAAWNALTGS